MVKRGTSSVFGQSGFPTCLSDRFLEHGFMDEALDPLHLGFLGLPTVMPCTNCLTDSVKHSWLLCAEMPQGGISILPPPDCSAPCTLFRIA